MTLPDPITDDIAPGGVRDELAHIKAARKTMPLPPITIPAGWGRSPLMSGGFAPRADGGQPVTMTIRPAGRAPRTASLDRA